VLYAGEPLGSPPIRLVAPRPDEVASAETDERDNDGPWSRWFSSARTGPVVYFSVEDAGRIVGEVFLHDVDPSRREALVGYRIFQPEDRRRGIGTAALGLLIDWARSSGELDSVVAIARSDNEESRRLAERAGFSHVGAAREDAGRVAYRKLLTTDPS